MPTGRLFTYSTAKGYRFITHGNNEKDVFVHASAGIELTANISLAGLMLEYEIGLGKYNKKQALNIKVVDNDKICVNHQSKEVVLNKIMV